MRNLKINNLLFLILFSFIFSCQSNQNFKITTLKTEDLHIIELESNRLTQECYFLNAEKGNNWRHQYSLNLLNEKNEVISAFYPTNQGKQECLAHLKRVENILHNQSQVRLCVRGRLKQMIGDKSDPEVHDFGALGKHESPYYALTFDTICNSKECYSISDTWTQTCPGFEKE